MKRAVRSYCRQCIAVCGLVVTVEDDEILTVRGDPDHPVTRGYTCAKGRALGAMHHAHDRLDDPQLRRGDRLVPVPWDALLDDLATRLSRLAAACGPDAVGTYFGSLSGWDPAGRAVGEAFHRALGSRSRYTSTTTDCPAKPLVAQAVLGHAAITPLPDLESCTLLLLIGTNPVVSHGHTWAIPDPVVAIRAARRRGEVWVVDPRRTETARLATRHLASRAGTDHALLGHLLRELLRSGCDQRYLDAHAVGIDELRAAVERFDASSTAAITGLAPSELAERRRRQRDRVVRRRAHRRDRLTRPTGRHVVQPRPARPPRRARHRRAQEQTAPAGPAEPAGAAQAIRAVPLCRDGR